ncbi:MAG: dienelactone hydrolase [Planctomycetota bacterium]|jgi:dienelactone hydrolase
MSIVSDEISYRVGEREYRGYQAFDDSKPGSRPGIIVVHEWWGLNEYILKRTHMLAEQGYFVLAIDMYGEGRVGSSPDEAAALMNGVLDDMDAGESLLKAGYQTLLEQELVDDTRTAAIGYCFGGGMALHMARIGMPLKAVVSFHGSLNAFHRAEPGTIKPEILLCHGKSDSMVKMNAVEAFEGEMKLAQANYQILLLEGAKHGFSNLQSDINAELYGIDLGYSQSADRASWSAMLTLLNKVFK